jgi:L-lactate dehydrogenase (cytochrome)
LKGVQSAEDAFQALAYDVQGIYLSNHGGRQLDHAPSSLETLLEIRAKYPEVLRKLDIYLDGGVWRGADVVKALCLGAKAVGLGRGFMFALSAYGTEGVLRAIQSKLFSVYDSEHTDHPVVLSDEIQTTMRLLGVTDLAQLDDTYVNTTMLSRDIFSARL